MRAKFMTSAATFAGILAFTVLAGQAQAFNGPPQHHNDDKTVEDSYNNKSGNDIDDSFNDNSKHDTDVDVADSFNDNSTDDSFNDNRKYDTDVDVDVDDSFNDNRKYETDVDVDDSFNDNRKYDTDVDIDDSFNDNRKYEDSFNTDNSQDTWNIRVSLNNQQLSANVSDVKIDMDEDNWGDQNARIRTGNIHQNGGAFAGFAGIQTVSNNTGLASIGQAATAVSANANVSFGGGGGK